MTDISRLQPVQAVQTNAVEHRAKTELARTVAKHLDWLLQPYRGSVHEQDGTVVADSIEALARAGDSLNWYAPQGMGIYWGGVHTHDPARTAREVREVLAEENMTIVDE